ncbi:TetR/AcrR family transcriptional regulator [Isoptericola sp. NPDC019693]|uniref:TetR/AcrR family transcriptional regulator n=1 Tax=Isoptericola sp. NPDC019693 TaxID=3364009 RepID=UPI00379E5F1C
MPTDPAEPRPDRRAELKARTRRAIVAAAGSLMNEAGGVGFSVDELAARAGVSRRTVFNHFPSLDDVVAAVGADAFGMVRDALLAVDAPPPRRDDAHARRTAVLADLVGALRRADLVAPMASLTRGLGLTGGSADAAVVPAHQAMLLLRSLSDVSADLAADLRGRHPGTAPVDVDLLVAQTMSSLVVLHRHWYARTGGVSDAEARAVWAGLLTHLAPALATATTPSAATPPEGHHG